MFPEGNCGSSANYLGKSLVERWSWGSVEGSADLLFHA
jgi:hypothetical protein